MSFYESMNPIMYNWNKVYIGYCDGNSFSGRRLSPVAVDGTKEVVHYKGHFILDAVYDMLLMQHSMNTASEVLISGSSAGGLAVLLHLDYIYHKIKNRSKTKPIITGFADAAYFMDAPSITGEFKLNQVFQAIYDVANVSLNQRCMKFYSSKDLPSQGT